jgi:hypothetical protein
MDFVWISFLWKQRMIDYYVTAFIPEGPSWPWSYGSWIYNYLWNQCLTPLMWVRISIRRVVQHNVIKFIRHLRQVSGFLRFSGFLHQYNWNIVESGIKHHQTNKQTLYSGDKYSVQMKFNQWLTDLHSSHNDITITIGTFDKRDSIDS